MGSAGRAARARATGLMAMVALLAGGCSQIADVYYYRIPSIDDLWRTISWFDHMIGARYVRPYQTVAVPRYTPEGTVPVSGGEADWSADWISGNPATADALQNPFRVGGAGEPTEPGPDVPVIPRDVNAAGDTLYQTFCAVCHGAAGDAKGPVSPRIGAPSLLTGRARAYTDGYIYSIIRYGRGVMPRYGDKLYLPFDRWAIVNHVRQLQAGSPAPQEPPGAAVPIKPGPSATGSTGARPR
ncbi:MAG: c-type cytochrome [Gemmatimonadales bacterium]